MTVSQMLAFATEIWLTFACYTLQYQICQLVSFWASAGWLIYLGVIALSAFSLILIHKRYQKSLDDGNPMKGVPTYPRSVAHHIPEGAHMMRTSSPNQQIRAPPNSKLALPLAAMEEHV